MPKWELINQARLRNDPQFGTTDEDGLNGAFMFSIPDEARKVFVIASDGIGWKHVSVSFGRASTKTPSWEVMCYIKDIFWDAEDAVIQIHPPKSNYVNVHPGCLHLWQCADGREQPLPPSMMVGPRSLNVI